MDLEEELELDDEDDEIEDIGRVLPADVSDEDADFGGDESDDLSDDDGDGGEPDSGGDEE